MQSIYRFLASVALVALTGCASMEQMQAAMNEIDQSWGSINRKFIAENGSRHLPVSLEQAKHAVAAGITSLGFERTHETFTSRTFKAPSPAPLTEAEYEQIRIVEEPIMQAMASNHVGSFTSSFFVLSSNYKKMITVFYVRFDSNYEFTTLVHLNFTLEWVGGPRQEGLLYGENPPPEAVRRGVDKVWNSILENL